MEGAGTLSPDEIDEDTDRQGRGRRRKNHRSRGLSEKLRRSQKAARMRKIFTVIVLGGVVVLASIYVARTSTSYEPVPTAPGE